MKNKIIKALTIFSFVWTQLLFANDALLPQYLPLTQSEATNFKLYRIGDIITFIYDGDYYQAQYLGRDGDDNGLPTFLINDITKLNPPDSTNSTTRPLQTSFKLSTSDISREAFNGSLTAGAGTGIYLAFVPPSEQNKIKSTQQQLAESYAKLQALSSQIETDLFEGTKSIATGTLEHLATQVQINQKANDALNISFNTKYKISVVNEEFVARAEPLLISLNEFQPKSSGQSNLKKVGIASVAAAEHAYLINNEELADTLLTTAEIIANLLISTNPFASFTTNAYELFVGKNLITGELLSDWERAISGVTFITDLVTYGAASSTIKAAEAIIEIFSKLRRAGFGPTAKIIDAAEGTAFVLGKSSAMRKVHLRSTTHPKWGLTKKHVDKHFFKDPDHALKNIDPKGNPDQWMSNLSNLFQQPATKTYPNGVKEIIGSFKKATGEDYKLGIRIFQKNDGSYDLVTVLTDQTKM